jgi:hypothetical protein
MDKSFEVGKVSTRKVGSTNIKPHPSQDSQKLLPGWMAITSYCQCQTQQVTEVPQPRKLAEVNPFPNGEQIDVFKTKYHEYTIKLGTVTNKKVSAELCGCTVYLGRSPSKEER